MSSLVHCIYTSVQAEHITAAEVARLVQQSRQRNLERDITGLLLHVEDTFFQILEGAPDVLESLYAKILVDLRHKRITRIIFEPIPRRFFADSSMTLATLTPSELTRLLREDNPALRESLLADIDEGRAKRLIRAFADGRWRTHIGSAPPAAVTA